MGEYYPQSVSRVYADANQKLGPEWYEYGKPVQIVRTKSEYEMQIAWGPPDPYEVLHKLGRGRYSEVMAGVYQPTGQEVVMKILKPVERKKIKREIKVLQNLQGGPNIIRLLDVVRDPVAKTPSIITEWIDNVDSKVLYPTFDNQDIRYYTYELLKALEYCHSHGVIHRDVKPLNILIDHPRRLLRLIDFGLAEFYHPGVELNVRVASRFYKAPELLMDMTDYDYSMDMWSVGTTLGLMVFRKDPLFRGDDNYDQLVKISRVLGTDDLVAMIEKYQLDIDPEYNNILVEHRKKPWSKLITPDNEHLVSNEAIDLLDRLLRYDFAERLSAKEAMAHPYFDGVRAAEQNRKRERIIGLEKQLEVEERTEQNGNGLRRR